MSTASTERVPSAEPVSTTVAGRPSSVPRATAVTVPAGKRSRHARVENVEPPAVVCESAALPPAVGAGAAAARRGRVRARYGAGRGSSRSERSPKSPTSTGAALAASGAAASARPPDDRADPPAPSGVWTGAAARGSSLPPRAVSSARPPTRSATIAAAVAIQRSASDDRRSSRPASGSVAGTGVALAQRGRHEAATGDVVERLGLEPRADAFVAAVVVSHRHSDVRGSGPGSRPVPEDVPRGSRAPRDPGADGARRDVEHLGDLRVVEVAQVAEHHRDPELLGHLPQRGVDVEARRDAVPRSTNPAPRVRVRRDPRGRAGAGAGGARRARRWWRSGSTRC